MSDCEDKTLYGEVMELKKAWAEFKRQTLEPLFRLFDKIYKRK